RDPPLPERDNGLRGGRVDLVGVQSKLLNRLAQAFGVIVAILGECPERRERDVLGVDFKMPPEFRTGGAAAKTIGAQDDVTPRNPLADLISPSTDVIARGDDRAVDPLEGARQIARVGRLSGVETILAACRASLAGQFGVARRAP